LVHGSVPGDELDVLLCEDGLAVDAAHDGQPAQPLQPTNELGRVMTINDDFAVVSRLFPLSTLSQRG